MFTGVYELTIDDKNRLSIPSGLRAHIDPENKGVRLYLAPGERERTLELFTEAQYTRYVEKLHETLTDSPEAADFELFFLSMSTLLEVDKQGRALLPQHQLQLAGIERQVVLRGNWDRLVLQNRDAGQTFTQEMWRKYREMKQAAKRTVVSAEGRSATLGGPGVRA